ncbi:MAG: DNA (cytosine-5-)-methyltransferase [Ferruginibacter sp.]
MKFIDLFAGLGGFHIALTDLKHKCVFASELNEELGELYEKNHKTKIEGDINDVDVNSIPSHDILCAGFPCQPFSKAGAQLGLTDPTNGNLFYRIMEILKKHKPEYVFLENVANLKGHDDGNTWEVINKELSKFYDVKEEILSPHHFGIPQHRSRIYIVGRLKNKGGLEDFQFPQKEENENLSIHSIIIKDDKDFMTLRENTKNHLKVWQEFLDNLKPEEVPRFPIWAMEFGADYPFEGKAPIKLRKADLENKKGTFRKKIKGNSLDDMLQCLPIYAQDGIKGEQKEFPDWKKYYIRANREFYNKHKDWLKYWLPKIQDFENSHQKFEWNCGDKGPLIINDKIVQFRPSGIRVKMPTYSPALVLTTTQIPIFPWLNRYMMRKEAAKLQCMEGLNELPATIAKAFKAFGNNYLGVPLSGRAFRCNLFVRSSQKGFPLQFLTQLCSTTKHKLAS